MLRRDKFVYCRCCSCNSCCCCCCCSCCCCCKSAEWSQCLQQRSRTLTNRFIESDPWSAPILSQQQQFADTKGHGQLFMTVAVFTLFSISRPPFHNLRASRSGNRLLLCSSEMSDFEAPKLWDGAGEPGQESHNQPAGFYSLEVWGKYAEQTKDNVKYVPYRKSQNPQNCLGNWLDSFGTEITRWQSCDFQTKICCLIYLTNFSEMRQ